LPPRRSRRKAEPTAPAKRELPRVTFEELSDFNESINGCIYGDSGVGKTPLAAMAPNAVILSTEKGAISAKRFGSKAELIRASASWDHVEAGLELVEKRQAGKIPGKKRLDWMILDSVTKMQVLQIRWILERIHEVKEDRDLDIPAIQDHQKWQNMFKRFIDRIVDMDINVIFIATAMHKEDSEGEDIVLPDIQGKDYAIANYLCAQMDFVYCLKSATDKKTDQPYWKLLTRFRPPYFAKDRYDALPPVVIRPTMPDVVTAIMESGEYGAAEKAALEAPKRGRKVIQAQVEPEDDESDDEPPARPAKEKTRTPARKPPRGQRRGARVRTEDLDPDDPTGDEDDDFDEPDPRDELDEELRDSHTATSRRAKAAAKKPARGRKAKVEEEPDEDWFDPEAADEDIDFDDE
jgi:hypothetical protein